MLKNYKLKSGNYLKIEKNDIGYEYTLYEECKKLVDGGILENVKLNENQAFKEILKIFRIPTDIEYQEIDEEIEESYNLVFKDADSKIPMTEDELASEFWYGDIKKIKKYGYDMSRISGDLCDCFGNGRFVLEETNEEDKKIGQKRYMKCKICGKYSHL